MNLFCRLQHHQRTNGKGKKSVLEEGKLCTCLYIIGDKKNSCRVDLFCIVHLFVIVFDAWITRLLQKIFTNFPTIEPCHLYSDMQSQFSPEAVGWNICTCPWRNSPSLPVLFSSSWKFTELLVRWVNCNNPWLPCSAYCLGETEISWNFLLL